MPRLTAWKILRSKSTTPLREVDRFAAHAGLDDRDRGLLRHLVGTEVRRRGTLRAIVQKFARGKPSPDVTAHLRLGLAQLFFMDRVPPHAAVSETVRAAANTTGLGRGRYVNGVLRTILRERVPDHSGDPRRDVVGRPWHLKQPVFRDPELHPLLWAEDALNLPAALAKGWVRRHGTERAFELARLALEDAPLSLVALGIPRETLAQELAALDVPTVPGHHPDVLLAPSSETQRALDSPAFREGRATVQGETALSAAELLGAQEGMRVLDMCAAPGGKTAVLARTGAEVFALDVSAARLARVRSTLERLAPKARVHALASDSDSGLAPDATFDAALVDAPCSNTGVLSQRPGARWRYGPTQQRDLCALQASLLEGAAGHVRQGGRLVYSTCSLEPEENGQGVRAFLENHSEWTLVSERESTPAPSEAGGPTDGGYAALLERVSDVPGSDVPGSGGSGLGGSGAGDTGIRE